MNSTNYDIRRLRKKDERAWKSLFDECYAPMCHLALQYVGDPFLAEMMAEDVMCHLWESIDRIEISGSLINYLLQSVRNRCLDYNKSFHAKKVGHLQSDSLLYVDDASHPLGLLMESELFSHYQEAVMNLPDESRRVFLMSREEDMKYEEIAEQLDISVNTVKYHIKQSLAMLRDRLKKYL